MPSLERPSTMERAQLEGPRRRIIVIMLPRRWGEEGAAFVEVEGEEVFYLFGGGWRVAFEIGGRFFRHKVVVSSWGECVAFEGRERGIGWIHDGLDISRSLPENSCIAFVKFGNLVLTMCAFLSSVGVLFRVLILFQSVFFRFQIASEPGAHFSCRSRSGYPHGHDTSSDLRRGRKITVNDRFDGRLG